MRLFAAIRAFFAVLFGRAPALPSPDPAPPSTGASAAPADALEWGAVLTLRVLQTEGRLLDFLMEPIDAFEDADIGAAVREVHRGCGAALRQHFDLGPVLAGEEGESVDADALESPHSVRKTGQISKLDGHATLVHPGWRTGRVALPRPTPEQRPEIIMAAEVAIA